MLSNTPAAADAPHRMPALARPSFTLSRAHCDRFRTLASQARDPESLIAEVLVLRFLLRSASFCADEETRMGLAIAHDEALLRLAVTAVSDPVDRSIKKTMLLTGGAASPHHPYLDAAVKAALAAEEKLRWASVSCDAVSGSCSRGTGA